MAKYQFHRMNGNTFETMAQALIEKYRSHGTLIQFGTGKDGAREATWEQPCDHSGYSRPTNSEVDIPKKWVFQAKFHDMDATGWERAASALVRDLESELDKIVNKHKVPCHHYVLITNVPLSGVRFVGTRDRVTKTAEDWKHEIPEIEVWDAVDLSRMLDNNKDVRAAYIETILPGDVLSAIYLQVQSNADRRANTFKGYLNYLLDNESKARADEAGDDDALPLHKVFVDQTLRLDTGHLPPFYKQLVDSWQSCPLDESHSDPIIPEKLSSVSSSFPLLWGVHEKIMLLAGPGYGKSTLTQFLTLYHASRIIRPTFARVLAQRLKLPTAISADTLDAFCEMRFPFRIELRRYAKWRSSYTEQHGRGGISTYIAKELIGRNVDSTLNDDDIFDLASRNPILLILDGLDEVPSKETRDDILKDCDAFLHRCAGEDVNIQIVMSSRPQGYNGEFDRFEPLRWTINDLSEQDFYSYCESWLSERIKNAEERAEAEERIRRGMSSEAIRRLATTLLQATVMLTIVRRKSDIPEERHKLFNKYVDVVFQRETNKNELISKYEQELRRLHELVGYRLHEAVGKDNNASISEADFRKFVRETWLAYKGDEYFEGIPNNEWQKIIELARDRLVFLSGKGEDQTDVDFVIQPYREYFAAQYLHFHTAAEPNKVYDCLVERFHFWGNVLQFYVALNSPGQQLSWIYRTNEQIESLEGVDQLARRVEYERATLANVPEYERISLPEFKKAISAALPPNNWWTWLNQDWVISSLKKLRSGEAWRHLFSHFISSTNLSVGEVRFGLWIFPQIISKETPEYASLVSKVEELLSNDNFQREAVRAVIAHDIPLSLTLEHADAIIRIPRTLRYGWHSYAGTSSKELLEKFPRPIVIRLLLTQAFFIEYRMDGNLWSYLDLPVEVTQPVSAVPLKEQGLRYVSPYWTHLSVPDTSLYDLDTTSSEDAYELYVARLFKSLCSPDDPKLYLSCELFEKELPEAPWLLTCQEALGPSPEDFESYEDWRDYKKKVRAFFKDQEKISELNDVLATYWSDQPKKQNLWCSLMFHPKHWPLLVQHGVIAEEQLQGLLGQEWADLMALPKRFVEIGDIRIHHSLRASAIAAPIGELLMCGVTLHNEGNLVESFVALHILTETAEFQIPETSLRNIVYSLKNVQNFPSSWSRVILVAILRQKKVDIPMLSYFWRKLNEERKSPFWIGLLDIRQMHNVEMTINELLGTDKCDDLVLASMLYSRVEHISPEVRNSNATATLINMKIANSLLNTNTDASNFEALLNGLVQTVSTIAEVRLYADSKWFIRTEAKYPAFLRYLSEKIRDMPQVIEKEHYSELRSLLSTILSNTDGYPIEVHAAALDAIIRIDAESRKPLTESMWQYEI